MYDPLQDIHHYSKTLTISQVIKFCEKKELAVTRAMIQNYIRDGLLPPPVSKRYYTHKHLAALVLIDYLKTVFGIPEIKAALVPLMDAEGLPLETYAMLVHKLDTLSAFWKEEMAPRFFEKSVPQIQSLLLLMTHAADLKALCGELIGEA